MRAFLGASLVVLFVSTASAQFAQNPALQGNPPADPPKAVDAAVPPAAGAADPNAAGAINGGANALFAAIDLDGDGTISKVELRKAAASLKKLDKDNDGALTAAACGAGAGNAA